MFVCIHFIQIDTPTNVYGNSLRQQVEDRLKFYESGEAPRKNVDVMQEAMALAENEAAEETASKKKKKKKDKKRKSEAADADETIANGNGTLNTTNGDAEENGLNDTNGEPKKKKKKKKNKVKDNEE